MADQKKKKKQRTAKPSTRPTPQQLAKGKGGSNQGGGGDQTNLIAAITNAIPDLPPNIATQIGSMVASGADENRVFAFLKGTDWFNTAYAGFNQGVGSALWGGDLGGLAQYRDWRRTVNDTMKQYYGRAATAQDWLSYATQGFDANQVANQGQGHAWAQANMGDVNYYLGATGSGTLSPDQLQKLGEQEAGRTSDIGTMLDQKYQAARQKIMDLFGSQLAQQANQRLPATQNPNRSDVGA